MVATIGQAEMKSALDLEPGPCWDSFEQFRVGGVQEFRARLLPSQVGTLNVKGGQYCIMHAQTFQRLFGLAQGVDRLSRILHLARQAAELLLATGGSQLALEHLCDLVSQFQVLGIEAAPQLGTITFEESERADAGSDVDFELDPARLPRQQWMRG